MHERLVFREELLNSLSSCRADIEISLVHLIHVLKSKNVDEKTKLAIRDILVDIDYSIALTSADERTEQIERWIGLEYLFSHDEKAYMEHHEKEEARKERSERLDRNIVYKAVDDYLFG